MPDERPLCPATRDELLFSLAHGLRFDGKRRLNLSDDFLSRAGAEKLLDHLQRSGYVILKKPPQPVAPSSYVPPGRLTD